MCLQTGGGAGVNPVRNYFFLTRKRCRMFLNVKIKKCVHIWKDFGLFWNHSLKIKVLDRILNQQLFWFWSYRGEGQHFVDMSANFLNYFIDAFP